MGKYMRKAKVSGEVAVMEVSHQSSVGVRTRARTLAAAAAQDSSRAYLELRSRRLEKPLPPPSACKPCKDTSKPKPNASSKTDSRFSSQKSSPNRRSNSGSVDSVSTRRCSAAVEAEAPPDAEVSFGENILEADSRDRWVLIEYMNSSLFFFPSLAIVSRYNFDPVNDHPLPGRYEWVKVDF
ncbi:hypothetical protein BHM03_00026727 [Ensete ventricosum]|nr:hypothetical protein BHM03_00026727 [Ensete ventricosum]